jgi:hypothetical protein
MTLHGARAIPDVRGMIPRSDIVLSLPGNLVNFISRQYNIRKLVVIGRGAEGVKEDTEQHLRDTGTGPNMTNMFNFG